MDTTRRTVFTFPNLVLALVASFVVLLAWPGIQKNYGGGSIAQPTTVPTRAAPPANNPPLPTSAPNIGSAPDVMPTPAPLVEAAPVIGGLTESMERKFEEAAQPGVADKILSVVESWESATPIPGAPPEDKGGGKSLGRPVGGGTSGGKSWEPAP